MIGKFTYICLLLVWTGSFDSASFAQTYNNKDSQKNRSVECIQRIHEKWKFTELKELSFCTPFDTVFVNKRGVDVFAENYKGADTIIQVFYGVNSPTPGGPEQRLTSYSENEQIVNGIKALTWRYKDEIGELGYVFAARFYLEGTRDGDAILLHLSSPNEGLLNHADKIFQSVRFRKSFRSHKE